MENCEIQYRQGAWGENLQHWLCSLHCTALETNELLKCGERYQWTWGTASSSPTQLGRGQRVVVKHSSLHLSSNGSELRVCLSWAHTNLSHQSSPPTPVVKADFSVSSLSGDCVLLRFSSLTSILVISPNITQEGRLKQCQAPIIYWGESSMKFHWCLSPYHLQHLTMLIASN